MSSLRYIARVTPALVAALAGARRPPFMPPAVQIEPTNYCNLDCTACQRRALKGSGTLDNRHMTVAEFTRIVRRIRPVMIELTGLGEPMLNPGYFDMLRIGREFGAVVSTFCNMTLLDDEKIERLLDAAPHVFRVSLDAADAATFKKVRGRDLFDKVVAGIGTLRARRDRLGRKRPEILGCFVLLGDNLHQAGDFVRCARDLGVERLHLQLLDLTGLADEAGRLLGGRLPSEYRTAIEEAGALAKSLGIRSDAAGLAQTVFPAWEEIVASRGHRRPSGVCLYPWLSTYVTVDGSVRPCCMSSPGLDDDVIMGNLFAEPFEKIWRGARYVRFREKILSGAVPAICRFCPARTFSMLLMNSNIGRLVARAVLP